MQGENLAVDSSTAQQKRTLAEQWFTLGADAGLTSSQVYLAALLHKLGKLEEGLNWLIAATNTKDFQVWAKAINYLHENWGKAQSDFLRMNLEELRVGIGKRNGIAGDSIKPDPF